MDTTAIRALWKPRRGDASATSAMWDAMADEFETHEAPSFEDDAFLRLVDRNAMVSSVSRVLDVACGTGPYAIALAGRVRSVTGIDISPAMVERAGARAESLGVRNAEFHVSDWRGFDLAAHQMEGAFDLVFAHMTPAIDGPDVFEKLIRASRGWCAISKPTRRNDPLSDAIRGLVGIEENREDGAADLAYGFALLWGMGMLPRMEYEDTVWEHRRPLEKARQVYVNRMRTYRELNDDDVQRIDGYLESHVGPDGLVGERTTVTIAHMYWHI